MVANGKRNSRMNPRARIIRLLSARDGYGPRVGAGRVFLF